MRFNPKAQSGSGAERRSGGGGGLGGGVGGGGRLTLGGVLVAGLLYLVAQVTGVDVNGIVGGGGGGDETSDGVTCTGQQANTATADDCSISLLRTSIEDYWTSTFEEQVDGAYEPARTVIFSGSTSSGCGAAQAAMGPFYCPNDQRVYIDTDFMDDMLEGDLGAEGGTFALAYVLAHEYGHHVEDQLGYLARIRTQQGPRSDSVRAELMADCLGGMWAKGAGATKDENGQAIVEDITRDDIARAIDAAQAVGDDRIQQRSGGAVDTEAFTHGSAKQRVRWFTIGLEKGSLRACDTFATNSL